DLEQKRAVLVVIIIGLHDPGVGEDVRRPEKALATEPGRRLLVSLLSDQVEYTAADIGLVVEPSALFNVDRERAAVSVPPLLAILLCWLVKQPDRDRLHHRVNFLREPHLFKAP